MRHSIIILSSLLLTIVANAQSVVCTDQDRSLFKEKMLELQELPKLDSSQLITTIGKTFLGTEYVAQTLEINEDENLVINLRSFDCTTYVENVLAFSLLLSREETSFNSFASVLQNIRYRDGYLNGYGSRLHYFTDWIADNATKGLVVDITAEIGGVPIQKEIRFMTEHRDLYPMLKNDDNFESIRIAEDRLNRETIYFLPQDLVPEAENLIKDGDIIALATSIKSLDVTHTGFAILLETGRIHLLHASSSGKVEISEKPLSEYLKAIKKNTGIIVARPL